VPGRVVAKAGAEGVQGIGMSAGAGSAVSAAGLALKVEDGDSSGRARNVATCDALLQVGVLGAAELDGLAEYASPPILDPRGNVAGSVRPAIHLSRETARLPAP